MSSDPCEYPDHMMGLWEWLADHGYALSVDLYGPGEFSEGVWVATALESVSPDEDVTHRGEPAETPYRAVLALWAAMRGEMTA